MNVDRTTKQKFDLSHAVPSKIPTGKKRTNLLTNEDINKIEARKKEEVIFSWRLFDRNHEYFNVGKCEESWFISLLDGLRDISRMTVGEFRQHSERRGLRVHSHNWQRATAKFNMPGDWFEQNKENCLQFSVSKAKGRVHGILIDNIFYIVWLDPYHNLYPPKERNRQVAKHPYPVTEYEILRYQYYELQKNYKAVKEDLSACEDLMSTVK